MNTIRITGSGPTGKSYKVYLDDMEISKFVRSLEIEMSISDVNYVTLRCIGKVELPDELQALVTVQQISEHGEAIIMPCDSHVIFNPAKGIAELRGEE